MPYIAINTAEELSSAAKEKVKAGFGRLITIIPSKSEAGLMVDFSGSRTMYKAGAEVSGAFIDVRLFHEAAFEAKKEFTGETFKMLSRELGLAEENMYLTITEYGNWGSAGTLKQ